MPNRLVPLALALAILSSAHPAGAEQKNCSQTIIDGTTPPQTLYFIYPRVAVEPFYQWENNNGYCGEVAIMEAGLNNGQWMSQYNTRLVCGTGLSQSGPNGFCAEHGVPDFNSQVLIESPGTGVSGPNRYADAAGCLSNSRLHATTYDYTTEQPGMAGYDDFIQWIKGEVISGHQVGLALLDGGGDPQEDHEVSVVKIGTNHCLVPGPNNTCAQFDNSRYYGDDVLYIEDHGADTARPDTNPAIPPGAGSTTGCTPYLYGYSFEVLARTEAEENVLSNSYPGQAYAIVIPGGSRDATSFPWIYTGTGGDGYSARRGYEGTVRIRGPHNFAFSVWGPEDPTRETLPVSLTIVGPTSTDGVLNPLDPVPGFGENPGEILGEVQSEIQSDSQSEALSKDSANDLNDLIDAWYENPMIGKSVLGASCTNRLDGWMTIYNLQVTVSGLTPGVAYNLYEYAAPSLSTTKIGAAAALPVPIKDFNAHADQAASVTTFTATESTFTETIDSISSSEVVVFRAVPVNAP
jgi:hypothetical protein